jgi:LPPG:FO 2-phospho-L-lactate transferase
MKLVALAGGVGAGKFLRGLVRAIPPSDVTVVVNTGDDIELHGLHISPDIDSVTYWLADVADRERGWGRAKETFTAMDKVRELGGQAWFGLGDQDLATHLVRTQWLAEGKPLSEITDRLRRAHEISTPLLPMSDDPVRTWMLEVDDEGMEHYQPFQMYWVGHGGRCHVKEIRFEGADDATPAPGVVEAIADADTILLCPSNPVVSIGPILSVPGIREAIPGRPVIGVSPIVAGAPLAGMADKLMPVAGLEVSAFGAASAYKDLATGFVIDERDEALATRIEGELGMRVAVTDTIMSDDAAAERVARAALELL